MNLNLSREVIEKNAEEIRVKLKEEERARRLKFEEDCQKTFHDASDLVMKSKDEFVYTKIPIRGRVSYCSKFREFKEVMNQNGIQVEERFLNGKVSYYVSEKEKRLIF